MAADAVGRRADLCRWVRRYLEAHPEAADNLSGIRQWWLPEPLREVDLEELRGALAHLVATGEVQRSALPDKSELYTRGSATGTRKSRQKR